MYIIGLLRAKVGVSVMPDLYVMFISRSPLAAGRWPLAVMPLAVANFPLLIFYGKLTEKQRKHSVSRMT